MSVRIKVFFVFLLVFSLLIGQSDALLAQSKAAPNVAVFSPLTPSSAGTVPVKLPGASAAARAALPSSPQASGSDKWRNTGLAVGLGLSATGAALLAKKEPVHQTVCITYDSCPVPGLVHMTGGLMLGVGVPLTILKLVKH